MKFASNLWSFKRIAKLSNSFYLVVALIQILLILLALVFTQQTIDLLDQNETDKVNGITEFVNNQVNQATTRALIGISGIVHNPSIVAAFKAKDRERLLQASMPLWEDLRPQGFAQFQYHVSVNNNTDVISFLRVHEPARFNDKLTAIRPTVVKANLTKSLVKGLEQGRYGYSFRAVAPITADNEFVGTAELGFDFGDAFLELLNNNFQGNWAVYNLARGVKALDDRVVINSIGPDKERFFKNIPPSEAIMARISRGDHFFERDAESRTSSLYIPVRNFQGDIVLVVKYVYASQYQSRITSVILTSIVICVIGLIVSSLIILVLYRLVTRPIGQLVQETERIKNFQLSDTSPIASPLSEVQELIDAMSGMKTGLQSFRRYVPAELVRELIQTKQEARISGQRKNITVFFSDIEGFTEISEQLTPNELTSQLSEYLNEMTKIILKHHGTVDKYIGDAIMAFWNAPLDMPGHATHACEAALECQQRLKEMAITWQQNGRRPFRTRIGINTGDIIVGNIGSEERFSYTVIGDAVNLASRLEGLNKAYGTHVIISQNTFNQLPDDFATRRLDYVVVKGKSEPVAIYELVAEKGDITSLDLEFLKGFNQAAELYLLREWDKAIKRFSKLLEKRPDDYACTLYIQRCECFRLTPPSDDWEGEYVFHEK